MKLSAKSIPNLLSIARIFAAPVLAYLIFSRAEQPFTWLLLSSLISDILDGLIARTFKLQSQLGAMLDSIGDMLTMLCAVTGLFVFKGEFLSTHSAPLLALIALYLTEMGLAVWRYGKISSFHTYLCRVAAYAQGTFIITLFLFGPSEFIFWMMFTLSALAYVEEMVILSMLPAWTPNVRGLYWVTKVRIETA